MAGGGWLLVGGWWRVSGVGWWAEVGVWQISLFLTIVPLIKVITISFFSEKDAGSFVI